MRSARSGPGGRALTRLVTALLHAGAASVAAQAPARPDTTVPAGTVVGSVVAAQTGSPLEDALVLLEPAPAGAMPAAPGGPSDSSVFVIEYAAGLDVVIRAQGAGTAVLEAASEGK